LGLACRSQATPNPKLFIRRRVRLLDERIARGTARARHIFFVAVEATTGYLAGLVGLRGLRFLLNTSVAVLVLSLPFAATGATRASTPMPITAAASAVADADASRAQPAARGSIAASRNPVTVAAAGTQPIQELTIREGDTLATIANYYHLSVEAVAFANGITDADGTRLGQQMMIPPAEGALYMVKAGDTVDSLAARFKVDPSVIMSYNRLYFEPEHGAPGQLIFVPGAALPALRVKEPERVANVVLANPRFAAIPARTGSLSRPVNGVITQNFWWGHTGTDIAAPYGTGIGASDAGVVSATGWVAVGGLRVCVQHASDLQTCYYHTSVVYVSVGEAVSRGQIIAAIGLSGVTTGPHVHWECKLGGVLVDCLSL
jgi:murein DD-endopeptidase MepM/ murein hydrolase activator NlpD